MNSQIRNMNNNNPLNSIKKWNIGSTIRELLLANPEIKELIGDKIFPIVAPEDTTGMFIIYKRESYSKETVHQGVYSDDCKLSLTIISESYDETVRLAELIDNTLCGIHNLTLLTTPEASGKEPQPYRLKIDLADSTEDFDDYKYFQILILSIK